MRINEIRFVKNANYREYVIVNAHKKETRLYDFYC